LSLTTVATPAEPCACRGEDGRYQIVPQAFLAGVLEALAELA
jgi:hypothetical protein